MTPRSKEDLYNLQFSIEMSVDALDLIVSFAESIGFSLDKIALYKKIRYNYYHIDDNSINVYIEEEQKQYAKIAFVNREFCHYLIDLGFLEKSYYITDDINPFVVEIIEEFKKSATIRMPNLGDIRSNRDLYLAFLLGVWDSEGKQGETRITSGSRLYLEDIRNIFGIPYIVRSDSINSGVYHLYLGVQLMREMLESYQGPLPSFYKRKSLKSIKHLGDLV